MDCGVMSVSVQSKTAPSVPALRETYTYVCEDGGRIQHTSHTTQCHGVRGRNLDADLRNCRCARSGGIGVLRTERARSQGSIPSSSVGQHACDGPVSDVRAVELELLGSLFAAGDILVCVCLAVVFVDSVHRRVDHQHGLPQFLGRTRTDQRGRASRTCSDSCAGGGGGSRTACAVDLAFRVGRRTDIESGSREFLHCLSAA